MIIVCFGIISAHRTHALCLFYAMGRKFRG